MEIRDIVEHITEKGVVDPIHKLSMKYTGQQYYGGYAPAERQFQETQVMYNIRPIKVCIYPSLNTRHQETRETVSFFSNLKLETERTVAYER